MSEQVEGLVDSENDEFEKGVTALCSRWERMDSHDHGPLQALEDGLFGTKKKKKNFAKGERNSY